MDYETRAAWIRRLIIVVFGAIAIVVGLQFDFLKLADQEEIEDAVVEGKMAGPTSSEFEEMIKRSDTLTVVNIMQDGNPGAENFAQIIQALKDEKIFPANVDYVQFDIDGYESVAKQKLVNLETFNGRLDFYGDGKKLGFLVGPSNREKVEETITYYLQGLLKRYKKGWRPEVPGMESK